MSKSTFDAPRINGFRFFPENLTVIGVDTEDGPEHELWDERIKLPLDESMVLSIMSLGVKEAILVRKGLKGRPEVVDGRRRVLHAREANKRLAKLGEEAVEIPALQERGDETHLFEVSIVTNEHRVDDDVLIKATKAHRLLARCGDIDRVAARFGVTKAAVNNWLKLIELSAPVKKAVADGKVSASAAAQLHGLDKDEQVAELAKLLESGEKVTAKKAKVAKKKAQKEDGAVAPGKRLVYRVMKLNNKAEVLPRDFVRGVEWVLGEISPSAIGGLTALINEAEAKKAAKGKKKAEAAE